MDPKSGVHFWVRCSRRRVHRHRVRARSSDVWCADGNCGPDKQSVSARPELEPTPAVRAGRASPLFPPTGCASPDWTGSIPRPRPHPQCRARPPFCAREGIRASRLRNGGERSRAPPAQRGRRRRCIPGEELADIPDADLHGDAASPRSLWRAIAMPTRDRHRRAAEDAGCRLCGSPGDLLRQIDVGSKSRDRRVARSRRAAVQRGRDDEQVCAVVS
jgi:hypothetical protein